MINKHLGSNLCGTYTVGFSQQFRAWDLGGQKPLSAVGFTFEFEAPAICFIFAPVQQTLGGSFFAMQLHSNRLVMASD